jgi:hypothetical protein
VAAAEAEDHAAAAHVVEHGDLLGDTDRVVPGQDDDHRAHLRGLRARGDPGEILQHVGAHRVVGEVMLDAPDRLEAERLGEIDEGQVVVVDGAVRPRVARVLKDDRRPDVHAPRLPRWALSDNRAPLSRHP